MPAPTIARSDLFPNMNILTGPVWNRDDSPEDGLRNPPGFPTLKITGAGKFWHGRMKL
jgi:hypothetical protein